MTAKENLETLLSHIGDKPVPMARMAAVLLAMGKAERARELCARAVALAPGNAEVHGLAAEVFSHGIAQWYFPMVGDGIRHDAYEAALRRAIQPNSRVLEIGTGTGLLAMMAARAGAAEVVTCESNRVVAAAASEIIARNGFADRVRVVAMHSTDLQVGRDLAERADVLVCDALSNSMIGAGALPAIEHAVRRLLRPGARVIPARGTIRVALAEDRRDRRSRMGVVEGFDLSPFNRLAAASYQIPVGEERLTLRSEPGDLFHFDFESGGPFPEKKDSVTLTTSGGRVNGIVQWLSFDMDKDARYENQPRVGSMSTFAPLFYPLMRPLELAPGSKLTIVGSHDRLSLRIWVESHG
jgi:protein arginine N-methyltransferase 7